MRKVHEQASKTADGEQQDEKFLVQGGQERFEQIVYHSQTDETHNEQVQHGFHQLAKRTKPIFFLVLETLF